MKKYQFELTSQSPATLTEEFIVKSIWHGDFPAGSTLPSERKLSEQIGVTRTTLREVLQRLARDGWLTIQHGKASQINEIWKTANPNIIHTLIELDRNLLPIIVNNVVMLRTQMGEQYIPEAVMKYGEGVQEIFKDLSIPDLKLKAQDYAEFDYNLYHAFAFCAEKPVYGLILNSFKDIYLKIATFFFTHPQAKLNTHKFYLQLQKLCAEQNVEKIRQLLKEHKSSSQAIWKEMEESLKLNQLQI